MDTVDAVLLLILVLVVLIPILIAWGYRERCGRLVAQRECARLVAQSRAPQQPYNTGLVDQPPYQDIMA